MTRLYNANTSRIMAGTTQGQGTVLRLKCLWLDHPITRSIGQWWIAVGVVEFKANATSSAQPWLVLFGARPIPGRNVRECKRNAIRFGAEFNFDPYTCQATKGCCDDFMCQNEGSVSSKRDN